MRQSLPKTASDKIWQNAEMRVPLPMWVLSTCAVGCQSDADIRTLFPGQKEPQRAGHDQQTIPEVLREAQGSAFVHGNCTQRASSKNSWTKLPVPNDNFHW